MKRSLLFFLVVTTSAFLKASDDQFKEQNYGLWATRKFAKTALVPQNNPDVVKKAYVELGLNQVHTDLENSELTVIAGSTIFKAKRNKNMMGDSLHIFEWKEGLGGTFTEQYKKAFCQNRIHVCPFDEHADKAAMSSLDAKNHKN